MRKGQSNQKCSVAGCGQLSIPGLVRGHGKCQYHWNAGVWGKEWADKVKIDKQKVEEVTHV